MQYDFRRASVVEVTTSRGLEDNFHRGFRVRMQITEVPHPAPEVRVRLRASPPKFCRIAEVLSRIIGVARRLLESQRELPSGAPDYL